MKRGSILTILVVLMIFSTVLFGSLEFEHKDGGAIKLGLPFPLVYGSIPRVASGSIVSQLILNSSTRLTIYNYISNSPGVHFRGICNGLGLPVGVVQYHLNRLTTQGLLTSRKDRKYRRYFEAKRFNKEEMSVISTLRSETTRRAVSTILLMRFPYSGKSLTENLNKMVVWHTKETLKISLTNSTRARKALSGDAPRKISFSL